MKRMARFHAPLLAVLAALLAGPPAPAQNKRNQYLVWNKPATIQRVKKPNRPSGVIVRKTERAPLLTLQWRVFRRENGNLRQEVDPATLFKTGDQIKLGITVNQNGYLYVINQPADKSGVVVFPDPRINGGANRVEKNRELIIPAYCPSFPAPDDCWWEMSGAPGREVMVVIFSRDPITTLPTEFGRPVTLETVALLRSASRQQVATFTGATQRPGEPESRFATRLQNTNPKDNEELIAAIELTHIE